jgi:hypothetical protein
VRTSTAPEQAVLSGAHSKQYVWVEIQDEVDAWVDYSDYLSLDRQDAVEVTQDNNERIAKATIQIARDLTGGATLSPLSNTDIDLGRGLRVYGARVAHGTTPGAGDKKLIFDGRIDRWEAAQDPMVITGRDRAGILFDRWVETDTIYGSEAGVAIETVMQSIIDDHAGSAFTLVVAAGSGILTTPFLISPEYLAEKQPVWDALQALAELIGYVIEYRWSDSAGAFQLELYEPDRTTATVQWTFDEDDYFDVTKLDVDLIDVRNAWSLIYRDSGTGNRTTVTAEDAVSQARFNIRLWAEIEEGDDSPIDTAAEAQAMVDAAAADTAFPDADHEIETDFFWPVQLGDYYRHTANDVHYDTDQDFAVSGIRHTFANGVGETRILTRGKPAGNPYSWRRRAKGLPTGAVDGKMWVVVDKSAKTLDLYAETVGAVINYPVTLDIYENTPISAVILSHSFAASGETIGPTGSGEDTEYAALTAFALPKVGIRLYYGKLTDRNGVVRWISTAGDLDSQPGGVVTLDDYVAQPKLICTYDDDVVRIVITTPAGPKTYSGLSGGGQVTYQVGVTALDSAATEADLDVSETREGYVVTYYGAASAGAAHTAFAGPLHGDTSLIPSLVLESVTEDTTPAPLYSDATAVDGYVHRGSFGTWAQVTGGVGEAADYNGVNVQMKFKYAGSSWSTIARGVFLYNVAANLPENAEVTAAVLSLKCLSTTPDYHGESLVLTNAPVTAYTSLIAGDYQLLKTGPVEHGVGRVAVADLVGGEAFTFELNQTALDTLNSTIVSGNVFELGLFFSSDFDGTEPVSPPTAEESVLIGSVNNVTEANRPTLTLTYGGGYATVVLRMSDPGAIAESVEYQYKTGSEEWTAWAEYLSGATARSQTPEADGTYVFDADPTPPIRFGIVERPLSYAQARIKTVVAGDTIYTDPVITPGLDSGTRPNVVANAVADANFNVAPEASGDFDTVSMRVAFAVGANPTKPTKVAIRARDAINGRTFTAEDVSFGYDDIPVVPEPGEKVIFGILGYTAVDGGGLEATNVEYCEYTRPTELAGADPQIDSLSAMAVDDTVGGVDVTGTWTVSNVVDGTHDMEIIAEWPESIGLSDSDTETTPDAVTALAINFGGAGAGGADPIPVTTKCKVTALLKVQATGAVIHSRVAYSVGIAT